MDEELYFDTRNKKGQKYGNFLRYKKEKSIKTLIKLKKKIHKEYNNNQVETPFLDERYNQLSTYSWYRCRHHHHCHKCHPYKAKVSKMGKPKTIFRKREYKNDDFDIIVNH